MPRSCDGETEELLSRLRDGDGSAAEDLFARHRDRLCRMVSVRMDERLTGRADPSDVVQETMTTAFQRLPEYLQQPEVPFYAWLRQLAHDRLVDLYRRHVVAEKRSLNHEAPLPMCDGSSVQLADQLVAAESGPMSHLFRDELRQRVRVMIDALPSVDREILVLKHLEELTNAECAAVLEISLLATKKRYLRALERLRGVINARPSGQSDER